MALTEAKDVPAKTAQGRSRDGQRNVGAPLAAWVAPVFGLGLGVVYLGERVLVENPVGATTASALGVLLCAAVTALRFVPIAGDRERTAVARLLGGLQILGTVGLGVHFALSEAALTRLGLYATDVPAWRDAAQVFWVAALALSVVGLLFAEVAVAPMRRASHIEVRRVQSAAASGLVLGLAATYGSLFVYAAAQKEAQADFSYFKTSKPGEATLKLVDQISEPIRVVGFFPQVSEVRKEVQSYLSVLQKRNPKLEVQLVDRYLEPKLARELKVVSDGSIVLSRGETQQTLSVGIELAKARTKLVSLDKDFNSRLMKLMRSKRVAYLTVGHGELNEGERGSADVAEGRTASVFKQLIEQQNYRFKDLGLTQGLGSQVPDDADVVVILGPVQPFAPEEIAAIARYAEAGGKVLMALDTDAISTAPAAAGVAPGQEAAGVAAPDKRWLVELAATVGAEFQLVGLADEERFLARRNEPSDRVILPTNRFSSHASVSTLSRNSARAGVVVAGANYLKKSDGGRFQSEVTVRTFPSAFADLNGDFKQGSDEAKEVYNLGVALTLPNSGAQSEKVDAKEKDKDQKPDLLQADPKARAEMRAFVFADADVFSDLLMSRVPGNQMLAFDAMRWLAGEESFAGEVESEEDVRLEPSKQKDVAWFYATIFGAPILVLLGGVLVSRGARARGGKQS